jgi:putative transposase
MPHHVTQRGNNRQDVFFVDDDRRFYLDLLNEKSRRYGLKVLAYCLMANHVHLVVVPHTEESLSKALGRTHFEYTQYVNRLHGRSGHLWQNRFYSCPLGEVHLWRAISYVERNPVRAKTVRVAWRYAWSSAGPHIGVAESDLLDLRWWRSVWSAAKWKRELQNAEDAAVTESISRYTHTGRPLAGDRLIAKLEHRLGRRLRARSVGRPRKAVAPAKKTS